MTEWYLDQPTSDTPPSKELDPNDPAPTCEQLTTQLETISAKSLDDFHSLRDIALALKALVEEINYPRRATRTREQYEHIATYTTAAFEAVAQHQTPLTATLLRSAALGIHWPDWVYGTSGWQPPRDLALAVVKYAAHANIQDCQLLQQVLRAADLYEKALTLGIAANNNTPLAVLEQIPLGQQYPCIFAAANPNADLKLATLSIEAVAGGELLDPFLYKSNPDNGAFEDEAFEYLAKEVQETRSCTFWEALLTLDQLVTTDLKETGISAESDDWVMFRDLKQCARRTPRIANLARNSAWTPFRTAVEQAQG